MIFFNKKLRPYLFLWGTQSLSALGSAMTNFALVIWLYQKSGSALQTALLSICTYTPYVLMSIFAGALSDRWNKKRTMLVCDLLAACCTISVLILLKTGMLAPWHMYVLNAINGLMNTVQQPAGEVAATLLIPKEYYQKTSGLRSFSSSLTSILTPVFATALFAFSGMDLVIWVDLFTFFLAFLSLLFFIKIPEASQKEKPREKLLYAAGLGLKWLKNCPLILTLILLMSVINLVASAYEAVLPALLLNRPNGGETVLGLVNSFVGVATLAGSFIATLLPKPRNRITVIWATLLFSFSTENFLLAFTQTPFWWCLGSVLGWAPIPLMNANLDVIFRTTIPADMQGRVYSCRNTLQFFTIPIGYFLGGLLVDRLFEPFMAARNDGFLVNIFGTGKGSGAALFFFVLGIIGVAVCLVFRKIIYKYTWAEPAS